MRNTSFKFGIGLCWIGTLSLNKYWSTSLVWCIPKGKTWIGVQTRADGVYSMRKLKRRWEERTVKVKGGRGGATRTLREFWMSALLLWRCQIPSWTRELLERLRGFGMLWSLTTQGKETSEAVMKRRAIIFIWILLDYFTSDASHTAVCSSVLSNIIAQAWN